MNEIVVGVDNSATARKAALEAADMASAYGRPLHLVMALDASSVKQVRSGSETWQVDRLTQAEESLKALAGEFVCSSVVTQAVVVNDPGKALCEEAERLDASVIVVGNKRVQGASRVLGSIANDVVRHAKCNVLIVHTT